MAIGNLFSSLFKGVKPSTKPKSQWSTHSEGDAITPESFSQYQDVSNVRSLGSDSFDIIKELHRYDPDAANALWAMLRFANTKLHIIYKDEKGEFDADKSRQFTTDLKAIWLFSVNNPTPEELADAIRRQLFMYGGVGVEVVLDPNKNPTSYVLVRNKDILWKLKGGRYVPYQKKSGGGTGEINLDIPTFFFQDLDKDPNYAAAESPLLTAIQAITFKQQVIADIQRVVKKAGYPRLKVTVLEDVMRKNAPRAVKSDEVKLAKWLKGQKKKLATELSKLKPEDAVVIFDSIELDYIETSSGSVDFRPVIEILDGQVVSALKSLPSILGKGKGGSQNIASVETMVYINTPTYLQRKAEKILSQMLTMSARLMGYKGYIECVHEAINLRPDLELEPQKLAKQNRILQLQSFGHITDSEAALLLGIDHLPASPLSGTEFLQSNPNTNTNNISPNADPLGRSITGGDGAGDTRGSSSPS